MDEESAAAAAEKVTLYFESSMHLCNRPFQADAIRVKVGYPISPNTQSAESLLRYYALVNISKFDYFKNMLSARYGIDILPLYVTEEHDPVQVTASRSGSSWENAVTLTHGR
jgi:hypothetical protein